MCLLVKESKFIEIRHPNWMLFRSWDKFDPEQPIEHKGDNAQFNINNN